MSRPLRVSRRSILLPAAGTAGLCALALGALLLEESRPPTPRGPTGRAHQAAPTAGNTSAPSARSTARGPLGPELLPWRDPLHQLGPAWTPFVSGAPDEGGAAIEAGRLCLALDTRGADPAQVHQVGLLRRAPALVGPGLLARLELDWRPPPNASGRSAGLTLTSADPFAGRSPPPPGELGRVDLSSLSPAVTLELIGVPPGHTARLQGSARGPAGVVPLFLDGWPQRRGRAVARIALEIEWSLAGVVLRADGRELARAAAPSARPQERVWLLLHAGSQAGFGPRPVEVLGVELAALGREG